MVERFLKDMNYITKYYEFLVEKTKNLEYVGITNEWLIDNYYLLAEVRKRIVRDNKGIKKRVKLSRYIQKVLESIILKYQYHIDLTTLKDELNSYQKEKQYYFSYAEISFIPYLLLFFHVHKLKELCEIEYRQLLCNKAISNLMEKIENKETTFLEFIKQNPSILKNEEYVFEINSQINTLEENRNITFRQLNLALEMTNRKLKEIINIGYQTRSNQAMLMSTIFNNIKKFLEYDNSKLYEKISYAEKRLLKDTVYRKMKEESKELYRQTISKKAKKEKISEYEYVTKLYKQKNEHIGFSLFPSQNYQLRFITYLSILLFLMVVSSYFCSYLIENRVFGFFLFLIPTSQLWIQIINHILTAFIKPKPLPKLDYSKGIPSEDATMIVIPTIIGDTEKIQKLFDMLETYYLINKTKNLYFTLLADVTSSKKEKEENDDIIAKYGVECAKKLNKKYNQELFYFVYRNRFYNEKEGYFLGIERKRGALIQFNQLLLHKFSKEEENKYFKVHTFHHFKTNISYVITLDTDTQLVLNTALNLIGAMSHPLNKPVLNEKRTKVVKGYALMQPRVSVDIEAINSSSYSQIFGSMGGIDAYTTIVPNFYFDVFKEGNFVGKGIYDLKIFDEILTNAFPDNLVLSHDLLEGNYLRCAYVADVELNEGFPSKFLSDTTRQYRWARGDFQNIQWLKPSIKNKQNKKIKNPLNLLEKFKMLDNITRMFFQLSLLLILLFTLSRGFFISSCAIVFILLEIILPIFFFLKSKLYYHKTDEQSIYYKELLVGGKSLLLRSYVLISTIPYYAQTYFVAFIKTMYRLFISHKNLLNWITAEEAERTLKSDLKTYLLNFVFNILLGLLLTIGGIYYQNLYSILFGILFISSPFVLWYLSQPLDSTTNRLDEREEEYVRRLGLETWKFFEDLLTKENNYLIPDNYQENRELKVDIRTSPTDIAFSLISVICAYHLKFVSKEKAIFYINRIVESIQSLEKWNGHLYNWYNIKTKEVMNPRFVSTVDSGNFVAALFVVNQFLIENKQYKLSEVVEKLIKKTNFKKLYTKKDVFSIGYQQTEEMLSVYNYNKFASESRLTSFLAIVKGDVPNHHWFCLDKSLTSFNGTKGLTSWSGTSFEYFMPLLFMKNYPHTLLDETYQFAYKCQKEYIDTIDKTLPWGLSESAYDELDNANSYKYKAFCTPYLKAKEEKNPRIVLSPYSSFMAMPLFKDAVYKNIMRFQKLGMRGKYGLYESYDTETTSPCYIYYSHHQGMSLAGITNYLKNNILQNYFHRDIRVRTFEMLLKEKVQVKTDIDLKIAKYKKYDYQKEKIENDIRAFSYVSDMPEVSVLSNKKYCLLMNDRGNGFSRYRTIQLNRYRKITEQDYGVFLYIRNKKTNEVISNTYAPMNEKADKYEIIFASDKIKYIKTNGNLTITTEIIVTKEHHAEIRKITFQNLGEEDVELELTTYLEPIVCENMADVSHPVFNNMFLKTYYDKETKSLISMRKSKLEGNANDYFIHRLVIENPKEEFSYETNRFHFIGRGNTTENPKGIFTTLSNQDNDGIEPIMSLRNSILVKAGEKENVCIVNGFGRSKEQIYSIASSYHDSLTISKAFKASALMNVENTKKMNVTGNEMRLYNVMLNYLYQTTNIAINEERKNYLRENALSQSSLWKFGISGDFPIILVDIDDIVDIPFVLQILKCFEYYKNHSIFVDVVILNSENEHDSSLIQREIDDEIYRMYTLNNFYHTPGRIFVVDKANLTEEEKKLFRVVPRLRFVLNDHKSLQEKIEILQEKNKIKVYQKVKVEQSKISEIPKLSFQNNFGGFDKEGKEYVITNMNTPTPWSNVIANEKIGTIITNNGCGFTYAYNSGEFKITSWTNDMVVNDKSEGLKIDGKIFEPGLCRHGFGYSVLEGEYDDLKITMTEFVPLYDSIKLYLVKLINQSKDSKELELSYWINPTFGNFEEKTNRHILTEYQKEDNYLKLRNVYSNSFNNIVVFMSSSLPLTGAVDNEVLVKEIKTKVTLKPYEEKEVVFTLGVNDNVDLLNEYLKKYNDVSIVKKTLQEVQQRWTDITSVIQVKTDDKSFDYMVNGWYLYQALSSRILAKSGFYQVSGAFGYRDQLQDTMNLSTIFPSLARNQILKNAAHQFKEGDVLHWWHEKNYFGLRSRYKDDYLWLVYATEEYLEKTQDTEILKVPIPYVEGEKLLSTEAEKGIVFRYSKKQESLLDHLLKSLSLAMNNIGKHGLPLMGGGDWNDGMNKVGILGKGESVWLGFFLYLTIERFIPILKQNDIDTTPYQKFNEKLKKNLNKNGYDGSYYLRAYFDNGDKLGSHTNKECKIDLISQSFSILSHVAPKNRIPSMLKAVEKDLVDNKNNIVKLLTPAFEKSKNNPGYIMNYPKGIRENGGQYTHAVAWYLMALIEIGNYDKAYEYFQMINPINRTISDEKIKIYQVEPYVIAADIYSNENIAGRGGWTWYTGSAGWFYKVAIEDILGLQVRGDKLYIKPHLPDKIKQYQVVYHYQETEYLISVKKGTEKENQASLEKEILLVNDKKKHKIEIHY